jgi:heme A synthase
MEALLIPLKLFAFNPIAALVISGIFAVGSYSKNYTRRSRLILGISAIIWMLYTLWELYMLSWRSPSGDMAIRVDLVIFGPVILLVAFIGIFSLFLGRKKNNA